MFEMLGFNANVHHSCLIVLERKINDLLIKARGCTGEVEAQKRLSGEEIFMHSKS